MRLACSTSVLLASGLLLVGCADDRLDCGVPDGAQLRINRLPGEAMPPPEGDPVPGVFTELGPAEAGFLPDPSYGAGQPVEAGVDPRTERRFALELADVELPDLVGEPVELTVFGLQPSPGDPISPVMHVLDPSDGSTRLLAGNAELQEPVHGWTVVAPRDLEACPQYDREGGVGFRKAAQFERSGQSLSLLPGEEGELDGFRVRLIEAESWVRLHPFLNCDPPGCQRERLDWVIEAPAS